jgi:hypothetical protein
MDFQFVQFSLKFMPQAIFFLNFIKELALWKMLMVEHVTLSSGFQLVCVTVCLRCSGFWSHNKDHKPQPDRAVAQLQQCGIPGLLPTAAARGKEDVDWGRFPCGHSSHKLLYPGETTPKPHSHYSAPFHGVINLDIGSILFKTRPLFKWSSPLGHAAGFAVEASVWVLGLPVLVKLL